MAKFYGRGFRPTYRGGGAPKRNYCPDTGEEVFYHDCVKCKKFGVHEEGDIERCAYEHAELKKNGFYAKTEDEWLECLRDTDYETYCRLIEEKRTRERVLAEMEAEKSGSVSHEDEGGEGEDDEKDEEIDDSPEDEDDRDSDESEPDDSKDEDDDEGYWW